MFDDNELTTTLDFCRAAVVRKIDGLTREQAIGIVLPSGVTLLGIVAHLAAVENEWFAHLLAGEAMNDYDNDVTFVVAPERTVADVVDEYAQACARSRSTIATHSLDDVTVLPHWHFGHTTARFVLFHLIRETSRHVGHMDVLRELTDGAIGF